MRVWQDRSYLREQGGVTLAPISVNGLLPATHSFQVQTRQRKQWMCLYRGDNAILSQTKNLQLRLGPNGYGILGAVPTLGSKKILICDI